MRYPTMTAKDANSFITGAREGQVQDVDALVRMKGNGDALDPSFAATLKKALDSLRAKWPDGIKSRSDPAGNAFEAAAARIVHRAIPNEPEMLADAEFWIWLAVVHCSETVEWRYCSSKKAGFAEMKNYGIGAKQENLVYRLWLRAELVLDVGAQDPYHLSLAGQVEFWRSHLFRQGFANVRNFSRALLRFQYPHADPADPNLKKPAIRDLVKRLRRLRSNLFLEILPEEACRAVIEAEAAVIATD